MLDLSALWSDGLTEGDPAAPAAVTVHVTGFLPIPWGAVLTNCRTGDTHSSGCFGKTHPLRCHLDFQFSNFFPNSISWTEFCDSGGRGGRGC